MIRMDEPTLDDMIEFCDHWADVHGELAKKVEKFGYTDDIHAGHEKMLRSIAEELWRLKDLMD
jgi:hypothetical protein